MVKRYVREEGTDMVRGAMDEADGWFTCRIAFVETVRAVGLCAGNRIAESFTGEWPAFSVVEIDERLVENAASLALAHDLRSLVSLHLAAALVLPVADLVVATWDRRLHAAARAEGLAVLPGAPG